MPDCKFRLSKFVKPPLVKFERVMSLQDAAEIMAARGVTAAPVVGDDDSLLGVLHWKKTLTALLDSGSTTTVGEVMDSSAWTIDVGEEWSAISDFLQNVAPALSSNEAVFVCKAGRLIGCLNTEELWLELISLLGRGMEALDYLELIMEYSPDSIFITDGGGRILKVSKASKVLSGILEEQVRGRHVGDLEKEMLFYPSAVVLALARKEKVTVVQQTQKGKTVVASAVPILDGGPRGEISYVLAVTRDVDTITREVLRSDSNTFRGPGKRTGGGKADTTDLSLRLPQAFEGAEEAGYEQLGLIAHSRPMRELVQLTRRLAPVDSTVLIEGESGVGKGLFARALHVFSGRKGEFVTVSCAAIPSELLESELFGYEPHAFTGASQRGKAGFFEAADGGTLFLDEIGEMPLHLQAKLLHVIEAKRITRIGSTRARPVDVRIIAATNRNLKELVAKGSFREDLFYRLNVVYLWIPPLRQRKEDIIPLAYYFLDRFNQKYGYNRKLSAKALAELVGYEWTGNVRELENAIERAIVTCPRDTIEAIDIFPTTASRTISGKEGPLVVKEIVPLRDARKNLEDQLISMAINQYGSLRRAASILGVNPSTVSRKNLTKRQSWHSPGNSASCDGYPEPD